jgi:UDP-GlcNAc:undecaprenyl-phosphate/decaprenyl-phosphate GlcNAc-1-phosphate transferase
MLALLILCAFISTFCCGALIRLGRSNARRYGIGMPQRFHVGHVPRLGGVGMWFACVCGWLWMGAAERFLPITNGIVFSAHDAAVWFVSVGVAVLAGAIEDVTHQLRARWRLALTIGAAFGAVWMLGLKIDRLGIEWIDGLLQGLPWVAFAIALLAVAGLPHAFNLIDG